MTLPDWVVEEIGTRMIVCKDDCGSHEAFPKGTPVIVTGTDGQYAKCHSFPNPTEVWAYIRKEDLCTEPPLFECDITEEEELPHSFITDYEGTPSETKTFDISSQNVKTDEETLIFVAQPSEDTDFPESCSMTLKGSVTWKRVMESTADLLENLGYKFDKEYLKEQINQLKPTR